MSSDTRRWYLVPIDSYTCDGPVGPEFAHKALKGHRIALPATLPGLFRRLLTFFIELNDVANLEIVEPSQPHTTLVALADLSDILRKPLE